MVLTPEVIDRLPFDIKEPVATGFLPKHTSRTRCHPKKTLIAMDFLE
jgi:hypothetical protein